MQLSELTKEITNVFQRCPTPFFHLPLSSQSRSCRFLAVIALYTFCFQLIFGLPLLQRSDGCQFIICVGSLASEILCIWPYHVSCLFQKSSIMVSSILIMSFMVSFLTSPLLDILCDLRIASISIASNLLLYFSVYLQFLDPYITNTQKKYFYHNLKNNCELVNL